MTTPNNAAPDNAQIAQATQKFNTMRQALGGLPSGKKIDVVPATDIYPNNANQMRQLGRINASTTVNDQLEDITLCGTPYKSKQVLIQSVDVVRKIAFLLPSVTKGGGVPNETNADAICWNINTNIERNIPYAKGTYTSVELPISDVSTQTRTDLPGKPSELLVNIGGVQFVIDASGNIYQVDDYDGTRSLLGNLNK